jgi:hypothetical protein
MKKYIKWILIGSMVSSFCLSCIARQTVPSLFISVTNTTTMFDGTNLCEIIDELETLYISLTNTQAILTEATNNIIFHSNTIFSGITTNVDLTSNTGMLYYSTGILTNSSGN